MSAPKYKKIAKEQKQKELKLQKERCALLHVIKLSKSFKKEFKPYVPPKSYHRENAQIPSLVTPSMVYETSRTEPKRYTGEYIIGIATMHKSNLVPVTRDGNPIDYATMRRN